MTFVSYPDIDVTFDSYPGIDVTSDPYPDIDVTSDSFRGIGVTSDSYPNIDLTVYLLHFAEYRGHDRRLAAADLPDDRNQFSVFDVYVDAEFKYKTKRPLKRVT